MIGRNFSPIELISLVEETFANQDEVTLVEALHGDDAQKFIDVADEVRLV